MSAQLALEAGLTPLNQPTKKLWVRWGALAALLLVSAGMLFYGLGNFPLFNPDEALYAEPAREMLETHDYLTCRLNYVVRFTKPPVSIWAMALAMRLFGVNEFAARFFGAVAAMALIAAVYGFLTRYVSHRAAWLGSATLLTAPLFVGTARESITDMYLTASLAGAMLCFYRAYSQQSLSWLWPAYALVGLAVMTKGPVALVLPGMALFVYHGLKGNWRQALSFYRLHWGALIVGAIALPWFIAEILVTKGAYFNEFIMRENVQRYTSVLDKHKGGWWYHLAAMSGGYFPWVAFIPQALVSTVFPLPLRSGDKINNWLAGYRSLSGQKDLAWFATSFVLVTLAFFSLSVSKLLPYTLPAFPFLAILVAIELDRVLEQGHIRRLLLPVGLLAIIYGAAGQWGPWLFIRLHHVPPGLWPIVSGYVAFQSMAILVTLLLSVFRRPTVAISCFSVLTLLSSAFFGYRLLSWLAEQWEGPIPALARLAGQSREPLFVYQARLPSVLFYARRATVLSPNQENLTTTMEAELDKIPQALIIARSGEQRHFQQTPGYRVECQQGNYILVHWKHP